MNLIKQRKIFNIFHDGLVVAITNQNNIYSIKFKIQYLAKLISPNFEYFYINLISCEELKFINWKNDEKIFDINKISKLKLIILSCDDKIFDKIKIFCVSQNGNDGELWITTKNIKVLDQEKNEISLKKLDIICNKYWNNWEKSKKINF